MKQILMLITAAVLAVGTTAFAGEECCPSKKGKDCVVVLDKLNLSEKQKKQVAALKAECDKTGCEVAAKAKFVAGLKKILTPQQIELCKKEGSGSCPLAAQ